jgi:hypothetical protein
MHADAGAFHDGMPGTHPDPLHNVAVTRRNRAFTVSVPRFAFKRDGCLMVGSQGRMPRKATGSERASGQFPVWQGDRMWLAGTLALPLKQTGHFRAWQRERGLIAESPMKSSTDRGGARTPCAPRLAEDCEPYLAENDL